MKQSPWWGTPFNLTPKEQRVLFLLARRIPPNKWPGRTGRGDLACLSARRLVTKDGNDCWCLTVKGALIVELLTSRKAEA